MLTGDIENGVEHLGNAVAVCGQPQQLLQVLQQTLPPQVFQLLLMKLPIAGQVYLALFCFILMIVFIYGGYVQNCGVARV
jgi:hypothetical protein